MNTTTTPRHSQTTLASFAYLQHWSTRLTQLARLARRENWDHVEHQADKRLPVLNTLVRRRFQRDAHRNRLEFANADDRSRCAFDTSLLTPADERLLGVLEYGPGPRGMQWQLDNFYVSGNRLLDRWFPALPRSVSRTNPEAPDFQPRTKAVRPGIVHLVDDHPERLPERWLAGRKRREAIQRLTARAERTIMLAGAHDHEPVPQRYRGRPQWLLPLRLPGQRAPLAMVVENNRSASLRTCLTLDMAYENARSLRRPGDCWLTRSRREAAGVAFRQAG